MFRTNLKAECHATLYVGAGWPCCSGIWTRVLHAQQFAKCSGNVFPVESLVASVGCEGSAVPFAPMLLCGSGSGACTHGHAGAEVRRRKLLHHDTVTTPSALLCLCQLAIPARRKHVMLLEQSCGNIRLWQYKSTVHSSRCRVQLNFACRGTMGIRQGEMMKDIMSVWPLNASISLTTHAQHC